MKKLSIALFALAAAVAMTPVAQATSSTPWNFTFSGNGFSGSGVLTVSSATGTPGGNEITAVTGTFTSGLFSGSLGLYDVGNYNSNSPSSSGTILGGTDWDDLLFPGNNAPTAGTCGTGGGGDYLDSCGILFDVVVGETTRYVALYGAGGGSYAAYYTGEETPSGVAASFSEAPEPSTMLLLGTGLLGLAMVLFRRVKFSGLSLRS
ncbi:MAG: PEP-CTERM sorting domain-containing protein [Terracidiphilus sp.]|jgi:hypothetical protein